MTTEREMLEYAAKACGIEIDWGMHERGNEACWHGAYEWNPLTNSADCAAMCAELGIDTLWTDTSVICADDSREKEVEEIYTFHHIDGMYSYCKDSAGNVVHLPAWSDIEVVT